MGKSQVGKGCFPLVTHTVGKFSTVHPLRLYVGDFPTKCTSVEKFPTVIKTVGNFLLPSMQWEISHCHDVVGKFLTGPVTVGNFLLQSEQGKIMGKCHDKIYSGKTVGKNQRQFDQKFMQIGTSTYTY